MFQIYRVHVFEKQKEQSSTILIVFKNKVRLKSPENTSTACEMAGISYLSVGLNPDCYFKSQG